jgi:V/A-type H+-transporting ATPase subunit I
MIVPMKKYNFLVFHKVHNTFIEGLKNLGVLHIIQSETMVSQTVIELKDKLKKIRELIHFLKSFKVNNYQFLKGDILDHPEKIISKVESLQLEKQLLDLKLQSLNKAITYAEPWGIFSPEILKKLKAAGVHTLMFSCTEKDFDPAWKKLYRLEIISVKAPDIYFTIIQYKDEIIDIKADQHNWPEQSVDILNADKNNINSRLQKINNELAEMNDEEIDSLRHYEQEVYTMMQIQEVHDQSMRLNDEKVMLLSGFVPDTAEENLKEYCEKENILTLNTPVKPSDNPPILLKNNRFSELYEFIGKLYSFPTYSEIDLTPFFAPFFMIFFGLCLGDAGYGLLMLLITSLYKMKANRALYPLLTLGQWLGLATVIFGVVTGTFFGLNLMGDRFAFLGSLRNIMLDSNQVFNFALVLGFIQIIFGLGIQIANKVKQYGLKYAVTPLAWIFMLMAIADVAILKISGPISMYVIYGSIAAILLFNDPDSGILPNIGKGIWELYGITGFVGDLLSYIRLFALGISGAILGLVVNDIALRMLSIDWIGPILFVAFLIFGHGLNLMISILGAFVHPLRLTFVEFYKNAGFTGGGQEYKPFGGKV